MIKKATPTDRYIFDLGRPEFHYDPRQEMAVRHSQRLYDDLAPALRTGNSFTRFFSNPKPIKGIYFFGGTGRGKTYLVDCFYECLETKKKFRVHYHRFMQDVHKQLQKLPKTSNPLAVIGDRLSLKYQVLCIDEFQVFDIGDAMILETLLKSLFSNKVVLVITSNTAIQDLYKDGLQRNRFEPAIQLLLEHCNEFDLGTGTDYRMLMIQDELVYKIGDIVNDIHFLENKMNSLSPCTPKRNHTIVIHRRKIKYNALADDIIWFNFEHLCRTTRSTNDYIELAEIFHTVLIGQIEVMDDDKIDVVRRFIHLIDALYDHNVKLVATLQSEPESLYTGHILKFPFQRTSSRLQEMSSRQYLSKPHLVKSKVIVP